ncbi:hypothetical protein N7540_005467 [Penicillium herquei]|nr:hypothetical protein N7540_005467 [Penicillium herquei]
MLSNLDINVNVSGTANWQSWSPTNAKWFEDSSWQTVVHYTEYIPQAHNIDDTVYYFPLYTIFFHIQCSHLTQDYNNGHGGWLHKRNFSLSVAQPSGPSDGAAWGVQSLSPWDLPGTSGSTSTDVTQVACAINTFGQTDRYKNGAKNGLCITGTRQNAGKVLSFPRFPIFRPLKTPFSLVYGTLVRTNGCNVVFTGSPAGHSNSKRDGSKEAG